MPRDLKAAPNAPDAVTAEDVLGVAAVLAGMGVVLSCDESPTLARDTVDLMLDEEGLTSRDVNASHAFHDTLLIALYDNTQDGFTATERELTAEIRTILSRLKAGVHREDAYPLYKTGRALLGELRRRRRGMADLGSKGRVGRSVAMCRRPRERRPRHRAVRRVRASSRDPGDPEPEPGSSSLTRPQDVVA